MITLLRVAGPALAAMALIASAPVRAITPDPPDRPPLRTCTPGKRMELRTVPSITQPS